MKVKDFVKHYSMASNATIKVNMTVGEERETRNYSKAELYALEECNAPLMGLTVGLITVINNTLVISAFDK